MDIMDCRSQLKWLDEKFSSGDDEMYNEVYLGVLRYTRSRKFA